MGLSIGKQIFPFHKGKISPLQGVPLEEGCHSILEGPVLVLGNAVNPNALAKAVISYLFTAIKGDVDLVVQQPLPLPINTTFAPSEVDGLEWEGQTPGLLLHFQAPVVATKRQKIHLVSFIIKPP